MTPISGLTAEALYESLEARGRRVPLRRVLDGPRWLAGCQCKPQGLGLCVDVSPEGVVSIECRDSNCAPRDILAELGLQLAPEPEPVQLTYGTVDYEKHLMRVRQQARDELAEEAAGELVLPPLRPLGAFLAEPDTDPSWRVDGLWPTGGRVVFSAQKKAGKTTTVANVLRSVVDCEPLFGQFEPIRAERVILLDNELDERMLRRWLRDQGIVNVGAVELIPLRGRLSTFNILDKATRSRWAQHLGEADIVVFDCLRPAMDALGLDENRDAGRFLEAFDELTTEAGISETLIVHHMGHAGERARGDSRILDWPDAVWSLVMEDAEDPTSSRYFRAYGRDVAQPEVLLGFDSETRRLAVAGGSRTDAKADNAIEDIIDLLIKSDSPLSGRGIETALGGVHSQKAIRDGIKRGVALGKIERGSGGRGGGSSYSIPAWSADALASNSRSA